MTSSAFAPTFDLTIGPRLFVFPWVVVDICAGALGNSISFAGVRTSPRSVLQGHERVFVFVVLPRGLRATTETERVFLVLFVFCLSGGVVVLSGATEFPSSGLDL